VPEPGQADEGFDELLGRLSSIVERMERGSLTLEESLRTFEEGVAVARRAHAILDAAEQRVETLTRE
jgi:exodeoxyribonuclease VII small subunit